MPLIFLDTPQIGLLEEKRRSDPVRYSSFRDAWNRRGYTLVLTGTQAGELCRYEDACRREGRYEVLADLAPVRTDFPTTQSASAGPRTLIEREILRTMAKRGLIPATGTGVHQLLEWTDVLPGRLNALEVGLLAMVMENQDYRDIVNQMYKAARFAARAEKVAAQTSKKPRVRDLPSAPVPKEKALDCWAGFENATTMLKEQSSQEKLPPIPDDALPVIANVFQDFLSRAQEIGTRATLLEYLPVVRFTKSEQLKLTTHDLVNCSVFESLVRFVARELLGESDSQQESLARTLDFADCPGSWLERRLRLCVERGSSEPAPSHHHDAERLAYLPYVDLLFTDAQMAEFVRQVRSDRSTPERIRALRPPMAVSASLAALEEALDSLNTRASGATPGA